AFPLLAEVHGLNWAFYALLLITPIGSVLYWTCFHAYFATLGDAEHRGGQLGAREALAALVSIVAPLVGAALLIGSGARIMFWIVAVLQVFAAAPLIGAPGGAAAREAPGGFRAARLGATLLATDGWFAAGYYYVWQIALFVTLDQSYSAYGGAMALAALVGAAPGPVIGRGREPRRARTA